MWKDLWKKLYGKLITIILYSFFGSSHNTSNNKTNNNLIQVKQVKYRAQNISVITEKFDNKNKSVKIKTRKEK